MKLLITGGTGFIGRLVCKNLTHQGHELTVFSRRPNEVKSICGQSTTAITSLNDLTPDNHFHAIINLAGEPIANARWTTARKKALRDSRIGITNQLIEFIARAEIKPAVMVSGSAIGFYGDQDDSILDEQSEYFDDFSHHLCADWEQSANQAAGLGVRVCILRTGLVIGKQGGFVQRMLLPFKLGLGGKIGTGRQWMSWIHRADLVAIIELMLNSSDMNGIYNGTAPNPVTNLEFTQSLATILKRPALLPVPGLVLKLMLGEMSELLLGGQRVMPQRLTEQGFKFRFDTLSNALDDILD